MDRMYVYANYAGMIRLTKDLIIYDVFYIPDFTLNIVSVQKLNNHSNLQRLFSHDNCQIQDIHTLRTIGLANLIDGLYQIVEEKNQYRVNNMSKFKTCEIDVWYYRLGHPSNKILDYICKNNVDIQYNEKNVCDHCYCVKQHRLSFPNSESVTHNSFDLVHIDIWGPFGIALVHRHRYFLTIVDDYSRHSWIFLMKNKGETKSLLHSFVTYVKTQFDKQIKIIRTDNGFELNHKVFYDSHGIIHQTSCIEMPQQNSVVERKHQHILNVARSNMFHSNLPKQFWSYVVCHAVFIINRLPSTAIQFKIPYELLFRQKPGMSVFKVFGCLCFHSTITNNRDKFDPKSRKCIFLGFKTGVKGYILFDTKTREIFISRDVIFHEDVFIQLDISDEQHDNKTEQNLIYMPHENTGNYIDNEVQPKENDEMQPGENGHENNDLRRSTRSRRALDYLRTIITKSLTQ